MFSTTLTGDMPSKKNAWKHFGNGRVYLDASMRSQLDDFLWQLKSSRAAHPGVSFPIEGPVKLTAVFVTRGKRDKDNMETTLLDLLQSAGIIGNDRNVFESHTKKVLCTQQTQTFISFSVEPVVPTLYTELKNSAVKVS